MKTHLNLGLAFINTAGNRVACFQLMEDGKRECIGIADYENAECYRFLVIERAKRERSALARDTAECAAPDAVKSLEFAYPTSDCANAFGHKDGCWVAKLGKRGEPLHAVLAFGPQDKAAAIDYVRGLPWPWWPITLHVHPEYAQ